MENTFKRMDTNPGAIVNTDISGLEAYKKHRKLVRESAEMNNRISQLETSVGEIKDLLLQLVKSGKE